MPIKKIQEKLKQVDQKAQKDKNFKEKLLNNPEQALKEINLSPPKGVKIKFLEQGRDNTYYHVINSHSELSEEEMESAAGGFCRPWDCVFNKKCF